MTTHEHDDPMFRQLGALPAASLDPACRERIRRRMRTTAERKVRARESRALAYSRLEQLLVGGLSFLYVVALAQGLLRWYGVL